MDPFFFFFFYSLIRYKKGGTSLPNSGLFSITKSSAYFDDVIMCCATNSEGHECTQLYNYGIKITARIGCSDLLVDSCFNVCVSFT